MDIANQIYIFFVKFINSPFFLTVKFILAIYVTVLFADIIMLIFFRGTKDIRQTFKGMNIPMVSPKKLRKKWETIKLRLESGETSQYKLAIIEADSMIEGMFKDMKFKGTDMTEMLDNLTDDQIENINDMKRAHKIRNQIIHDPTFPVDKKLAEEVLKIYETYLTDSQFLED